MTRSSIYRAVEEARRFLRAAEARLAEMTRDSEVVGSAKSGACRRASLDLTRALAEMRRSGRNNVDAR